MKNSTLHSNRFKFLLTAYGVGTAIFLVWAVLQFAPDFIDLTNAIQDTLSDGIVQIKQEYRYTAQ